MSLISLADVAKLAQQAAKYHHPHYQGVSKNEFNRVVFTFKPFTGTEAEPTYPSDILWEDDSLTEAARDLVRAEYDEARTLWRDTKYVYELKTATANASALWHTCTQARTEMDAAFAALDTTADTHWRSAVSKLVAVQDKAREAAEAWDATAATIADVHDAFLYSDLSRREAYQRAGVDATDWVIGSKDDYPSYWGTPVVRQVTEAIEEQHKHLRKVASLTGDRAPV